MTRPEVAERSTNNRRAVAALSHQEGKGREVEGKWKGSSTYVKVQTLGSYRARPRRLTVESFA